MAEATYFCEGCEEPHSYDPATTEDCDICKSYNVSDRDGKAIPAWSKCDNCGTPKCHDCCARFTCFVCGD